MIAVQDLSAVRGGIEVLSNITFEVPRAGRLALMGPSGSGKTTLLRLIAGLDEPSKGTVTLDGREASRPGIVLDPFGRNCSMAFQRPALWPHMTVEANVSFGLRKWGASRSAARTAELLEALSIAHLARRFPHQISGGEAQRAAIARALAPARPILLLDEPFSHLDPAMRLKTAALIREETEAAGATVILVSHDGSPALLPCTQVLRLTEGRTVSAGPPECCP